MEVKITISGLNRFVKTLKHAEQTDLLAAMKDANKTAAEDIRDVARTLAPRVSGDLAGTIRSSGSAQMGIVRAGTSKVPYAAPIHWGWHKRNITPNKFIYKAFDQRHASVIKTYLAELEKVILLFENPTGVD